MKHRNRIDTQARRSALCLALSLAFILCARAAALPAEKATLGALEEIVVLPWNVKLLARTDTGAATSSLDARDIVVKDNAVEFKLFEPGGAQAITLPIARWRTIRTSEGAARRPVVRIQLCFWVSDQRCDAGSVEAAAFHTYSGNRSN